MIALYVIESTGNFVKETVNRMMRDEKGRALELVLILLAVGGLVMAPLLSLMSSGLLSGQVYEKKTDELYAADAGVEDAIWRIQTNNLTFDANDRAYPEPFTVNDRNVNVTVYLEDVDPTACGKNFTYQILSTAVSADGSETEVEAHVTADVEYYTSVTGALVTVQHVVDDVKQLEDDMAKIGISCPTACTDCEAWCGKAYDYYAVYDSIPDGCRGCVAIYNFPSSVWPTVDSLNSTYWEDVKDAVPYYTEKLLYVKDYPDGIGPFYWDQDKTAEIQNKESDGLILKLNGTVYTICDTIIGQSGNKDFILDLNGHTIFAASNSSADTGSLALVIGGRCSVQGPGLIIAVGDVKFAPKAVSGGEGAPVFILSVDGEADVQPSGDWWGSIAARVDVKLGSGTAPSTTYPTDGFGSEGFPFPLVKAGQTINIASWSINPP
jgi:hypothetical protein